MADKLVPEAQPLIVGVQSLPVEARPTTEIEKLLRNFVSSAEFRKEFQANPDEVLTRYSIALAPKDKAYVLQNMDALSHIGDKVDEVMANFFFFFAA